MRFEGVSTVFCDKQEQSMDCSVVSLGEGNQSAMVQDVAVRGRQESYASGNPHSSDYRVSFPKGDATCRTTETRDGRELVCKTEEWD